MGTTTQHMVIHHIPGEWVIIGVITPTSSSTIRGNNIGTIRVTMSISIAPKPESMAEAARAFMEAAGLTLTAELTVAEVGITKPCLQ
jgi:hypothetical protein